MRFKKGGMALEAIREYVQLVLKGGEAEMARKEITMEARESLEIRLMEIQKSFDIINYKLDIYEQECGPITMKIGKENS